MEQPKLPSCVRCGWPLGDGMTMNLGQGRQHYSSPYCTSKIIDYGFGPAAKVIKGHPWFKQSEDQTEVPVPRF